MKKLFLLVGIFFILGCGNSNNNEKRGIILPVYFYNLSEWQRVVNANVDEIAIINPSNGPGSEIDDNYVEFISNLINSKKTPIGYVYTKWGDRDIEEVKDDIDTWISFYPKIKGFFIDEAAEGVDKLSYYQELRDYIKSKGNYYIVLNPGIMPNPAYFDIADNIVVYENNFSELNDSICTSYADKSSIIVYGANEEEMIDILNKYHCRYLYVTDDTLPNPYDTLPSYFDKEIELIK
jgi:hypothetical protein